MAFKNSIDRFPMLISMIKTTNTDTLEQLKDQNGSMKALSLQNIDSTLSWTEIAVPEEANAVLPKNNFLLFGQQRSPKWLQ